MPELNKANRQCADIDIRILKTKAPFLFFDTGNTTTAGISGSSVYARKKGTRAIAFEDPIEGTMTISAQVIPFKLYALFSDGTIHSDATHAVKATLESTVAGKLTMAPATGDSVVAGSVFVYPAGSFGDASAAIACTVADNTITATSASDIAVGSSYDVGYLVSRTSGVKRVSIATDKVPNDYFIQMNTVEKDEDGVITPYILTAYKASIQRTFTLTFSSEGDPSTVEITFDLLEDKNGNFLDIIEDTSAAS